MNLADELIPPETSRPLPPIISAADLIAQKLPKPDALVQGLLHKGTKMVLGGPSKAAKTFCLLDLGLSVAHGEPFWSMKTTKARVLFVNFEVHPAFLSERIGRIASEKRIAIHAQQFDVWNLRGHAAPYYTMLPMMAEEVKARGYGLIILDPLYKLLGQAEENSNTDMNALLNGVENEIVGPANTAVAFGAHFTKGNASGKDSIDRISGAGVFARDPDTILTLTKHQQDGAFTVEATLRNNPPMPPFVVRWDYPLMRRDTNLDPALLKAPARGRKSEHEASEITDLLKSGDMTYNEWRDLAENKGISKSSFYRLFKQAKAASSITEADGRWKLVPQVPNTHFETNETQ